MGRSTCLRCLCWWRGEACGLYCLPAWRQRMNPAAPVTRARCCHSSASCTVWSAWPPPQPPGWSRAGGVACFLAPLGRPPTRALRILGFSWRAGTCHSGFRCSGSRDTAVPGTYLSSSLRLWPCPLPPGVSFSVSCLSLPSSRSGLLPPTPCGAFPCARPVVSVREPFSPLAGPRMDTVAVSGPPQRRRRPGTRDWGRAVAVR